MAVLAHPPRGLAPRHVGERALEVRAEPVDLEREVHVGHHLIRELLELPALLVAQRGQQPRHRRHPPGHLLEQLVERARPVREQITVPRHEVLERRLDVLSARSTLDQPVELREHVAEPGELLGVEILEPLRHVPEVRAEDLLAQMLHQLVERPLSLRVDEPVVLELADLPGDVGREGVEEGLAHPGVVARFERQSRPLTVEDVLEPLAQLLQRPREVRARLLLLLAPLREPSSQRLHAA